MTEEKKIKFYLKKGQVRVAVANGDFAREFLKKEEPFEVAESDWEDHVRATGMFTKSKPKGSEEASTSASPDAEKEEV